MSGVGVYEGGEGVTVGRVQSVLPEIKVATKVNLVKQVYY